MPDTFREMIDNPDFQVIIYAGKGGLGKTTCSAATAYALAKKGKKILCFSTDPQASLSDIFEKDIFGEGVQELAPNLNVVEIDADKQIAEYQEEIRQKILNMYGLDSLPSEIDEYIQASAAEPAMYESATYDAMTDLVASREYDLYIFDMPPFGHGVRVISMATIMDAWIDKMDEARRKAQEYDVVAATLRGTTAAESEDAVLNELFEIRQKLDLFRDLLVDTKKTAFIMVMAPEKMAILDTERAIKMFEGLGVKLGGIIVNLVYPVELLERADVSPFLRNRIEMQQKYLREIWQKFRPHVRAVIPMFDREPKGMEMIARVADVMLNWEHTGGKAK